MIPRLGLDPSTLAIALDELFRPDQMRVGVKRAGAYGAHSQRIEGIMLESAARGKVAALIRLKPAGPIGP